MASEAGFKPNETDNLSPNEVWTHISGYARGVRKRWEMVRKICFYVAAYGNCDVKKFPKTERRFMPFEWDEAEVKSNSILEQHERMKKVRERLEKKINAS